MMSAQKSSQSDWMKPARYGFILIFLTFGVVGGWSAYAQLASAVVASGTLAVESSRKTVQHLEGGIIRVILVREGQRVKENEPLFRLDDTQAQGVVSATRLQLDTLLGAEARLKADLTQAERIDFPLELAGRQWDNRSVAEIMVDQTRQFDQRRASILGQKGLLRARIKQYHTEIEGLALERVANEKQLSLIASEVKDMQWLAEKNLVQRVRLTASQREEARLQGMVGRSVSDAAKAENAINEAELQIQQLDQKFLEEASTAFVETRAKIGELREKLRVSMDVLARLEVHSPRAGVVQNLRVFTQGAVVRPGEPLLDIAPEDEALIVQARVAPQDIDNIQIGQRAEISLSSFQAAKMPIIFGTIKTISRDRIEDANNRQAPPYFLAQVDVDEATVPAWVKDKIVAGMPADVVIPTRSRSVIAYVVEPFMIRLWKSFREE